MKTAMVGALAIMVLISGYGSNETNNESSTVSTKIMQLLTDNLTVAKVFLGINDQYTISNSGATVYGNTPISLDSW